MEIWIISTHIILANLMAIIGYSFSDESDSTDYSHFISNFNF